MTGKFESTEQTAYDRRERTPLTVQELAGIAGPLPEGMTAVELCREARRIGSQIRWDRYEAQLAEEEASRKC